MPLPAIHFSHLRCHLLKNFNKNFETLSNFLHTILSSRVLIVEWISASKFLAFYTKAKVAGMKFTQTTFFYSRILWTFLKGNLTLRFLSPLLTFVSRWTIFPVDESPGLILIGFSCCIMCRSSSNPQKKISLEKCDWNFDDVLWSFSGLLSFMRDISVKT